MVGAGLTTIDSADVYAAWVPGHTGGEGETVTGAWLKKRGHRNDETMPLEETLEAFVRLIKPGKRSPPTSRSRLDFSRANTAPKPIWRKARGAPAMSAGI